MYLNIIKNVDLSLREFEEHYHSLIDKAIFNKHLFVIGNAKGADTFALKYLLNNGVRPDDITIFIFSKHQSDKNLIQYYISKYKVNVHSGFKSYTERDAAMTNESHYDIAWVRSEQASRLLYKEHYKPRISGTQQNLNRRAKQTQNTSL